MANVVVVATIVIAVNLLHYYSCLSLTLIIPIIYVFQILDLIPLSLLYFFILSLLYVCFLRIFECL